MNRIIGFLIIVYFVSAIALWVVFSRNISANATVTRNLTATKNELAAVKKELEAEKLSRRSLEEKISSARTNATFLSFALCPTLESSSADALCIKNNTEWFSQTVLSGTLITDPSVKSKMETLLTALGSKNKPTSKQLYEILKPIEASSLKALAENLK